MALFHVGQITAKLLNQINGFGGFLLGQEKDFEVKIGALLCQLGQSILGSQNTGSRKPRKQSNQALQPKKGRWVKLGPTKPEAQQV
jgi:hypothetical protein